MFWKIVLSVVLFCESARVSAKQEPDLPVSTQPCEGLDYSLLK